MKRFTISVLAVSVFFLGLGALIDEAGAAFKSDEKALELIRKSRVAIGGESSIAAVQSMRITGRTSKTMTIEGVQRVEDGETVIAMQFPDKMSKTVKLGNATGEGAAHKIVTSDINVFATGDGKGKFEVKRLGDASEGTTRIIMKKDDGTIHELKGADAINWVSSDKAVGEGATTKHRVVLKKEDGTIQELTGDEAKTWIAKNGENGGEKKIVLKKVDGLVSEGDGTAHRSFIVKKGDDGNATFATSDGKTVEMDKKHRVIARSHGGGKAEWTGAKHNEMLKTTLSLLLTSPQGMDVSYKYAGDGNVDGITCDIVVAEFAGQAYKLFLDKSSSLPVAINYSAPRTPTVVKLDRAAATDGQKDNFVFRKMEGGARDSVEHQVRFSDFRAVNGVMLPYRWTQTVGGAIDETFDVTSYDINPANIAESFQNNVVKIRTSKKDGQ